MNSFNPESYDDDIIVVDMQSLGRGRGFEKTAEYSALGDESLTGRIADRMKAVLRLIDGGSSDSLLGGTVRLEDQVEELEDETHTLESELNRARRRIMELEAASKDSEVLDELLSMINEALDDTGEEDYEDLESAVGALIEEYDDLREETEDED